MHNHPLTRFPTTDPAGLYRVRDAMYAADMLTAALVHLDLFTRLAARPATLAGICADLGLAERPADVMLTLLAAMGLLEKRGGVFHLTHAAREHLVDGSPWCLKPYYATFKDRPVCIDLVQVLKTGKTASWGAKKDDRDWAKSMEDPRFAEEFTAAMDCRGGHLAPALARNVSFEGTRTLLDVAGGSGIYACAIAALHEHVRAAVFEKPPVDEVTAEMIDRRGFADRVAVIAGDMFAEPLPGGFDAHLFSNVIHDWDVPKVKALIAKSYAALVPGGRILVHDAHLNAEKTGPIEVAEYSVLLVHACEGRCYSVAEMEAYLREAGFGEIEHAPTRAHRGVIAARKSG